MSLNVKSLRAYILIMRTGTLSAAAKALHVSEPALSRQVAILETDLGLKLFSRDKRRLTPTPEGEDFFHVAQRILDSIEHLPEIVQEIKRGTKQTITLAVMPRASQTIVAPALAAFNRSHPNVQVSVEVHPGRQLARWVASRQFDLGVCSLPARHALIETQRICSVPAVAVVQEGDPLAQQTEISIADLADRPIIALPTTSLLGRQLHALYEVAGLDMQVAATVSTTALACRMVAQGMGVAISDALTAQASTGTEAVRLAGAQQMEFGLLFPRDAAKNDIVSDLANVIEKTAQNLVKTL